MGEVFEFGQDTKQSERARASKLNSNVEVRHHVLVSRTRNAMFELSHVSSSMSSNHPAEARLILVLKWHAILASFSRRPTYSFWEATPSHGMRGTSRQRSQERTSLSLNTSRCVETVSDRFDRLGGRESTWSSVRLKFKNPLLVHNMYQHFKGRIGECGYICCKLRYLTSLYFQVPCNP